jgi:predicted PurR-regulated permease PerM
MYFTAFILAIYMLASKHKLQRHFTRLLNAAVPSSISREIQSVLSIANRNFSNFITGQCLEALILGLLFFIILTILGMPYPFLLSALISVCAIIPYVGAFIGFFACAIIVLFIAPQKILIFAITFILLQQLEGQPILLFHHHR